MPEFEKRSLGLETLGEYLQSIRTSFGQDTCVVALATGVHVRYVHALEVGDFKALPEAVYVVGFLKSLTKYYGIPTEAVVEQFYREIGGAVDSRTVVATRFEAVTARLWPSRWKLGAAVLGTVFFIGACVWQVAAIGRTPLLTLSSPVPNQTIASTVVSVAGRTTPGSQVKVNGLTIFAGEDGTFSSPVSLLPGTQTLVVTSESRFGLTATKHVTFMVEEQPKDFPLGPFFNVGQKLSVQN